MGNKYTFLLIVLTLMLIGLVSPVNAASIPVYEKDINITISVPCIINGSYCSSSAICSATILNPDGLVLKNNVSMIRNNVVFNVNLSETDTSKNGLYEFNIVCSDLGNSYSKFLNFKITPNGENPSTAISIFYISLLIILVILFILTTIILFFHENFAWHIGLFSIDYILMLGISLIGWQMAENFLTSIPFISTILHIVWLLLMIGFFPFIIIISFEIGRASCRERG